ncbi:MAG: HNH endonuclease [Parcubacteria group bacterium Athens0714_25]|nr:MAG: HNH endonuclease [Parcubacteria group bacterium Athens0714_25]
MKCAWKICTKNVKPRRRFCSPQCKSKFFVDKRRKDIKKKSLQYKGGACQICGYNKCENALAFHHLEPAAKDFGVSEKGYTRSWDRVKSELDKCILLCSNCHIEVHARQLSEVTLIEKLGEFGEGEPL